MKLCLGESGLDGSGGFSGSDTGGPRNLHRQLSTAQEEHNYGKVGFTVFSGMIIVLLMKEIQFLIYLYKCYLSLNLRT